MIRLCLQHVKGSPSEVTVTPGPLYAPSCIPSGVGLSETWWQLTTNVTVVARDRCACVPVVACTCTLRFMSLDVRHGNVITEGGSKFEVVVDSAGKVCSIVADDVLPPSC